MSLDEIRALLKRCAPRCGCPLARCLSQRPSGPSAGRGRPPDAPAPPPRPFSAPKRRAAARKLPLIIANPDVVTVSGASLLPMPGQLGLWYREIDPALPVRIMGKPDAGIYEVR